MKINVNRTYHFTFGMSATFNIKRLANAIISQYEVDDDVVKFLENFRQSEEEAISGKVILVTDYSDKSAALFGDTKSIKDDLMALNEEKKKVVTFNGKLAFGAGWVITGKYLKDVKAFLDDNSIDYREISKEDYEEEVGSPSTKKTPAKAVAKTSKTPAKTTTKKTTAKTTKSKVAEKAPAKKSKAVEKEDEKDYTALTIVQLRAELEERGLTKSGKKQDLIDRLVKHDSGEIDPPKPTTKLAKGRKIEKPLPKGKTAPKVTARLNKWGNIEEEESGIVFMELPVGPGGKVLPVAIGIQNPECEYEEKGLASVTPLSEEAQVECENNKYRYLTMDILNLLKKKDSATYKKLISFVDDGAMNATTEEEE